MKSGFFHDHILKKTENNKIYSNGGLSYKVMSEYIKFFDEIILSTRIEKIRESETLNKSIVDGFKIEVNPIKEYRNYKDMFFNYRNIKSSINKKIMSVDVAIIRLPSIIGSIAINCVKEQKKSYIIEVVACPWDSLWNYGNIKGKLSAPIMYLKTKKYIKNSDYVHYVSEKFLQKRYPTKGLSIGCSDVVITDIKEEILNKRIEKINKKIDNKYIFGIVGSLNVAYKGHEVSIKALSLLKDKIDFELHFLGAGNKEKWIKLAKKYNVEKNIVFDGTLPSGEAVFNWLDNLDIHLMMSKTEGLPRILVEAMSRASISIGSDIGGIPELIDGNCIVEKNDYKGLANKIEEIINNKKLQIEIAKTNFNNSKRFEKDILDKKRNEFYEKFLKENLKI